MFFLINSKYTSPLLYLPPPFYGPCARLYKNEGWNWKNKHLNWNLTFNPTLSLWLLNLRNCLSKWKNNLKDRWKCLKVQVRVWLVKFAVFFSMPRVISKKSVGKIWGSWSKICYLCRMFGSWSTLDFQRKLANKSWTISEFQPTSNTKTECTCKMITKAQIKLIAIQEEL